MGTVVTGAVLAGVIGLIIRGMVQDKKKGISLQCGKCCEHCGGHCNPAVCGDSGSEEPR